MNKSIQKKLNLAGLKKQKILSEMGKPKYRRTYESSDDDDSLPRAKSTKLMSTSVMLSKKGEKKEKDPIGRQILNIETRMERAEQQRATIWMAKKANYESKLELEHLLVNKAERENKYMEDTFTKITMKRVKKEEHFKKISREEKRDLEYKLEKVQ